ncbi:hypothetical protein LZ30DRAFT_441493 [Colletotrichum cereale]|nr:hypothetical protein LZ30DRAFT_441493 [Colletotrichum cereale]
MAGAILAKPLAVLFGLVARAPRKSGGDAALAVARCRCRCRCHCHCAVPSSRAGAFLPGAARLMVRFPNTDRRSQQYTMYLL